MYSIITYFIHAIETTTTPFIHYHITYLPQHILQLMEVKKEDPFDIEGIEKPTMKMKDYTELKTYLLKEIREIL